MKHTTGASSPASRRKANVRPLRESGFIGNSFCTCRCKPAIRPTRFEPDKYFMGL